MPGVMRIIGDPKLLLKVDSAGTYTYIGEAPIGSATSSAVWSVMRITNSDSTIVYADSGESDQIWDNRASLSYS